MSLSGHQMLTIPFAALLLASVSTPVVVMLKLVDQLAMLGAATFDASPLMAAFIGLCFIATTILASIIAGPAYWSKKRYGRAVLAALAPLASLALVLGAVILVARS